MRGARLLPVVGWALLLGLAPWVSAQDDALADAFSLSLEVDVDSRPIVYHLYATASQGRITGARTLVVAHLRSSEGLTRVITLDYRGENRWHTVFPITDMARYWIEVHANVQTTTGDRERVELPTLYFQLPGGDTEDIDPELMRLQALVEEYEQTLERREAEREAFSQGLTERTASDPTLRMPTAQESQTPESTPAVPQPAIEESPWRWAAYIALALVNLLILGLAFWLYREFSGTGKGEIDEADDNADEDLLDEAFGALEGDEPAMEDFSEPGGTRKM
ncbi:hypothetical protein [Marinimicrobium alkaliphilum]|uniref:hypothetical protein n=1 Tax=Marinimicrobium alkaliphilum TaxID=2202654 RepID=UPI000DB937C2|nr:hypothetical protein [Marinimicrobium alkaliphilum]